MNQRRIDTDRPSATLAGDDAQNLLQAVTELSAVGELPRVIEVARKWARALTRADGVTFVLREGPLVYYADEEAIGPLWKGRRFPVDGCISGWAMVHRETVAIEDIYADDRIPVDAYRPTFVRSLLMVPVRFEDPLAAIGAYWATPHRATPRELVLVQSLANATSIALSNADLYQRLQEAVRVRDQFLSIAAHELRTPLTALQLHLQSAVSEIKRRSGDPLAKKLDAASKSGTRLETLVSHLLEGSRAATGRLELLMQPSVVDLACVARDVVHRFEEAGLAKCPIAMAGVEQLYGKWDPVRLDQILTNLVSNACKYGNDTPVRVELGCHDGSAIVTVHNGGDAIAADSLDRIFEPFVRARPADEGGGLGLGLFIVKRIVDAMGGSIAARSTTTDGTQFVVTIPGLLSAQSALHP